MTTLFDIAQNWLNQDPDAETHAELTALLTAAKNGDEKALAELQARFSDRLQFGTAGLRGPLQAGDVYKRQIYTGDHFCYWVFYLNTSIHFDEIELTIFI